MTIGWTPSRTTARASSRAVRPGDVVLTIGRATSTGVPTSSSGSSRDDRGTRAALPVHDARHRRSCALVRQARTAETSAALAWAAEREAVSVVGLGSNPLADEGVEALVLKLSGELAASEAEGESCAPGEEPRSAVCSPCAGRVAGRVRVRLRDPRHGRRWRLDERGAHGGTSQACSSGTSRMRPAPPGAPRAVRETGARRCVRRGRRGDGVSPAAEAARGDQGGGRRDAGDAQGGATDEQATFGECLQAPSTSCRRGGCSRPARLRGHHRRCADLAQARELHRERRRRPVKRRDRAHGRGSQASAGGVRRRA